MLWNEMTWPQLREIDKDTPVMIPLGSCEQHGHHLPVFVDTIEVQTIATRVEQQLSEQMLLVPTLWLGSSHHHIDFPGTISVLPSLYTQMIQQITACILEAGFKRLFFLNGHGGNRVPAAQALGELVCQNDHADDAYLTLASWWEIAAESLVAQKHGLTQPVVSHACEFETSLMLAIRPDLVAMDRVTRQAPALANDWFNSADDSSSRVAVFRRHRRFTTAGPTGLSAEAAKDKGQSILEAVTAEVTEFMTDYARWPQLKVLGPK